MCFPAVCDLLTHLAHGSIVGVPYHEDSSAWREELIQTLVAGQR